MEGRLFTLCGVLPIINNRDTTMNKLATCVINSANRELRWYYEGPATANNDPNFVGLELDDPNKLNKHLAWMYAPCRSGNMELVVVYIHATKPDGTQPYKKTT